MSLKNLIKASAGAALVLGTAAGTASALNVGVTNIADQAGAFTAKAPLKYASEIQQGTLTGPNNDRDESVIVSTFDVSTGSFPAGNVIVKATIAGATFDDVVSGGALDFGTECTGSPAATASISSGGAAGGTTVAWVVSNLNSCAPGERVFVTLPIDLDLGGAGVSVTFGVETESGGTPVDGGPATVSNFLVAAPAYSGKLTSGATATANVSEVTGAYKKFMGAATTATLGSVLISADTAVAIDLSGTVAFAATANYDKASVSIAGDFNAFLETSPTDDVLLGGTVAATKTAGAATFSFTEPSGIFGAAQNLQLVTDGDTAIPASAYAATVTPTLDLALSSTGLSVSPFSGNVGNVVRNGTSVRLPWVASASQAAASGTGATNFIRVTNRTAAAFGPITATVLASNQAASVSKTATLAPSLASGGELVVSSGTLETLLGTNYGRGDIEVSVEGAGAIVVQLVARPDGVYTIDNQ
jgi:hypothetical protein